MIDGLETAQRRALIPGDRLSSPRSVLFYQSLNSAVKTKERRGNGALSFGNRMNAYLVSSAVTDARTSRRAFGTRRAVLETTFESFEALASYSS